MPDLLKCAVWHGREPRTLDDLLADQFKQRVPVLLLREPANARSALPGFEGLVVPAAATAEERFPLTEARLFYADGLLHLLADGAATRWAAWCAGTDDQSVPPKPAWCRLGDGLPNESPVLLSDCRPLLLRRGGTSGLREARVNGEKLRAVEYFDHGVLRWWRLELNG